MPSQVLRPIPLGQVKLLLLLPLELPPEDPPEGEPRYTLDVEVWPGPLTKSLSQITATNSFPRTLEGMDQMVRWLEEQAEAHNEKA